MVYNALALKRVGTAPGHRQAAQLPRTPIGRVGADLLKEALAVFAFGPGQRYQMTHGPMRAKLPFAHQLLR